MRQCATALRERRSSFRFSGPSGANLSRLGLAVSDRLKLPLNRSGVSAGSGPLKSNRALSRWKWMLDVECWVFSSSFRLPCPETHPREQPLRFEAANAKNTSPTATRGRVHSGPLGPCPYGWCALGHPVFHSQTRASLVESLQQWLPTSAFYFLYFPPCSRGSRASLVVGGALPLAAGTSGKDRSAR